MEPIEDSGVGPMLLAACKRGNINLLKQLMEENKDKMDPNSVDGLGNSALHYAAMGNHIEIAELLLTKYSNTNTNIQNFAGDTPVHKAVEKDHLDFLKLLVQYGANSAIANKKGRNPATFARSNEARQLLYSAQVAHKVAPIKGIGNGDNSSQNTVANPLVKAQYDPDMIVGEGDTDD